MATLSLSKLDLSNFRSYKEARIQPEQNIIVLTGENGAGKTNILEAISLLSPAAQFRKARLQDYIHTESSANQAWTIHTDLNTIFGQQSVGSSLDQTSVSNRQSRFYKLNGKLLKTSSKLNEFISIAWITPQMDRIFIDQSQYRRRFFDHLVSGFHPHFNDMMVTYRKLLRERLSLLRSPQQDTRWIGLVEKKIAQIGVSLTADRLDFLRRFQPFLAQSKTDFLTPEISLLNWAEQSLAFKPALDLEEEWTHKLKESRNYDREAGSASIGCHKMDLQVRHPLKNREAKHCSTGEQKSFLIAMILAYIRMISGEKGFTPILLLDEVAAHLDERKRSALFEEIIETGAQSWLTGTEMSLFSEIRGKACSYNIDQSVIQRLA